VAAVAELYHGLQGLRIGQGQKPKELGAATGFMQFHANGLLLLLADLLQKLDEVIWIDHVLDLRLTYRSLVGACFAIQMQKAIAVTAKGSAGLALDDGGRFAIVMVTA